MLSTSKSSPKTPGPMCHSLQALVTIRDELVIVVFLFQGLRQLHVVASSTLRVQLLLFVMSLRDVQPFEYRIQNLLWVSKVFFRLDELKVLLGKDVQPCLQRICVTCSTAHCVFFGLPGCPKLHQSALPAQIVENRMDLEP